MTLAATARWVTYLLAGLGLGALGLGGELDPLVHGFLWAGFALSLVVPERTRARVAFSRIFTALVGSFLVLQVLRAVGTESAWMSLGLEFVGFLQVSRLFTRRVARDDQQIVVIALVHLIAATALSTDLAFGAIYVGYVIVVPWALTLSMLRAQIERKHSQAIGDTAGVAASRGLVDVRFLLGTSALSLPVLSVTALVFFLFPRVGMGMFAINRSTGQHTAGFSDSVELGLVGAVRDDPTVVLRVVPPNMPADPPEQGTLKMRGTSFDHYDGRRWSRTISDTVSLHGGGTGFYQVRRWPGLESTEPFQVILDPLDERVLFLPHGTVVINVPPRTNRGHREEVELRLGFGDEVRYVDRVGLGLSYTAYATAEDLPHRLSKEEEARYLALPPESDAIARHAADVTRDVPNDASLLTQAVLQHLRDSGRYRYTLDQPDTRGRAPLDAFLFDTHAGHCEYFSTAMAIMLRTLGVPTRNVTGFRGGRYNRFGGYYALRQADAHSWVEVFLPGRGWARRDPTPASRDAMGPSESALGVAALFDALRVRWERWIVQYDLETQMDLARRFRRWFSGGRGTGAGADVSRDERGVSRSRTFLTPRTVILAAIPLLMVIAGGAFLWLRHKGGRREKRITEASRIYARLDRKLRRRGRARPPHRTPLEHAKALEAERFEHAVLVRTVTERFVIARYGGRPLTIAETRELRELVARI